MSHGMMPLVLIVLLLMNQRGLEVPALSHGMERQAMSQIKTGTGLEMFHEKRFQGLDLVALLTGLGFQVGLAQCREMEVQQTRMDQWLIGRVQCHEMLFLAPNQAHHLMALECQVGLPKVQGQ